MSRGHDNKGRSSKDGRHLRITHFMMGKPAWKSLSPYDKAVYLEILALYNGSNNGFIGLGVRAAAERAGMSPNKANACLWTLQERGFIEPAQASAFSRKDRTATEWRLTHVSCDRTHQRPSNAFAKWTPDQPATRAAEPKAANDTGQAKPARSAVRVAA